MMTGSRYLLMLAALCADGYGIAAAPPHLSQQLPGDSVYRLDTTLTDQDGGNFKLENLSGRPVLIAMFYASCKYVCPLIVDAMSRIDRALSGDEKRAVHLVLVSFDSERDTPGVLKEMAAQRHLDTTRWTLARTDAAGVRKLAAVLGVQYRATTTGEFNHSSIITLLDSEGRIVARTARMSEQDQDLLQSLQHELARNKGAGADPGR